MATAPLGGGGEVSYSYSGLSDGSHSLTAAYSGDTSFLPSVSTGAPIAITIGNLNLALGGDEQDRRAWGRCRLQLPAFAAEPVGMAVDSAGNVFVGDSYHNAVKEIVAVNGVVSASSTVKTLGSNPANAIVVLVCDVHIARAVERNIVLTRSYPVNPQPSRLLSLPPPPAHPWAP